MVSISLWNDLTETQRELEFQQCPKLKKHWENSIKQSKLSSSTPRKSKQTRANRPECSHAQFFTRLLDELISRLQRSNQEEERLEFLYMNLFLILLVDLLGQIPTRRFLQCVLKRKHLLMHLHSSQLVQTLSKSCDSRDLKLHNQLVGQLQILLYHFPLDSQSGKTLSSKAWKRVQLESIQRLQQCSWQSCFQDTDLEQLACMATGEIVDRMIWKEWLEQFCVKGNRKYLHTLGSQLGIFGNEKEADTLTIQQLIACFLDEYCDIDKGLQSVEGSTLIIHEAKSAFFTELELWSDENSEEIVCGNQQSRLFPVAAIRKLGLQFLNVSDHLSRALALYRLEALHHTRQFLEATIPRLNMIRTLQHGEGSDSTFSTRFRGFSANAVALRSPLRIVKVARPLLGESFPSSVHARLEIELDHRHSLKEFDNFRADEVVYLVSIRAPNDEVEELARDMQGESTSSKSVDTSNYSDIPFPEEYGILYVRGGSLVSIHDERGVELTAEHPNGKGRVRQLVVALDGVQYKRDLEQQTMEAYEQANLLIRSHDGRVYEKVLEILQSRMAVIEDPVEEEEHALCVDQSRTLPAWLYDLFLGYEHPSLADYRAIAKQKGLSIIDFPLYHTLNNGVEAMDAFRTAEKNIVFQDVASKEVISAAQEAYPPFKYSENLFNGEITIYAHKQEASKVSTHLCYTPNQVKAIVNGMGEGLTLISGPPGTGKTTIATQLISNLYHSIPRTEKILILTQSNTALFDIHHTLLSLDKGMRPEEVVQLTQSDDPTEIETNVKGRVDWLLEHRVSLLQQVNSLIEWLWATNDAGDMKEVAASASYSCENAMYFYQFHVQPLLQLKQSQDTSRLTACFEQNHQRSPASQSELEEFAAHWEWIFSEIAALQPFEVLRSAKQREDWYLIHHARVIGVNVAHVASHYLHLCSLGLGISTIIMDEACQINELDSLLALSLAFGEMHSTTKSIHLKRLILIGDPIQKVPILHHPLLQAYGNFNQSFFMRMIRLGAVPIPLMDQVTSRQRIVDLYRWRYAETAIFAGLALEDHTIAQCNKRFQLENPGFTHVAQFIHLPEGTETRISSQSYVNEAEALFLTALVKYMWKIGYPAEIITILTPYRAQRELMTRYVVEAWRDHINSDQVRPKSVISTIDDYQSQQNDFVLVSMVRTTEWSVDRCRATCLFSRARLGLYMIGNIHTMLMSIELEPFIRRLLSIPPATGDQVDKLEEQQILEASTLMLLPDERFSETGVTRPPAEDQMTPSKAKRSTPRKKTPTKKRKVTTNASLSSKCVRIEKGLAELEIIVSSL